MGAINTDVNFAINFSSLESRLAVEGLTKIDLKAVHAFEYIR